MFEGINKYLPTPAGYATPDQVEFSKEIAKALLKPDNRRITHYTQGIGDILQVLSGRMRENQAMGIGQQIHRGQADTQAATVFGGATATAPTAANNKAEYLDRTGDMGLDRTGSLDTNDDYVKKLIQIESGGNPNAVTGSYRGLGQFSKEEEKKYGITDDNFTKPEIQKAAIKTKASDDSKALEALIGRKPTQGEIYLAHQQGVMGAANHIRNPDKPAWANMYNTPEYQRRGARMAQIAITGNIPKGHALKSRPLDEVTSGEFSKLWTSRFDTPASMPNAAQVAQAAPVGTEVAQPELATAEKMNLGAQDVAAAAPSATGVDLGQAGVPKPEQIAQARQPQSGAQRIPEGWVSIPGYTGPKPLIPRVENEAEVRQKLQHIFDPKAQEEYMQDYRKRAAPMSIPVPNGILQVDPRNPDKMSFIPQPKEVPLEITGLGKIMMETTVDGQGKPQYNLKIPGGGKSFNSLNELIDWSQQQHAKGKSYDTTATKASERYETMYENLHRHSMIASDGVNQIDLAKRMVDDPSFIAGSFDEKQIKFQRLLDTLGISTGGADPTMVFNKLVAGNILENIKSLGGQGLGQVRVAEMNVIKDMNASTNMTPGAIKAVIEINKRYLQRMADLGDLARDYHEEHGRLNAGFDRKVANHIATNPLFSPEEMQNYKEMFKSDKDKGGAAKPEEKKIKKYNPATGKIE